jgi:NTE family protein
VNKPIPPHIPNRGTAAPEVPKPCATPFQSIELLLQGGGALGAYQAGVYERLAEAGIEPTWIAGISIGAINSAIIAGNPLADRVARLRSFWEKVSDSHDLGANDFWSGLVMGDEMRSLANQVAAGTVLAKGVPGFFEPRMPPPYLPWVKGGPPSYYDTTPLRATLEGLVDFDLINRKEMRLSLGAVNVRTGDFAYFDNEVESIGPEHIMASSALPPGFNAVEIEGEYYWDGGMVSNTPLDWVLSARSGLDTLVLQVDLWSADGSLPRDLPTVAVRMKDIQYSSRSRAATTNFRRIEKLRTAYNELMAKMPEDLARSPQAQLLAKAADPALYNIIQLVYQSPNYEGQSKDFEFSRRTMLEHWRAGYDATGVTLSHPEVLQLPTPDQNPAIYNFVTTKDNPGEPGVGAR